MSLRVPLALILTSSVAWGDVPPGRYDLDAARGATYLVDSKPVPSCKGDTADEWKRLSSLLIDYSSSSVLVNGTSATLISTPPDWAAAKLDSHFLVEVAFWRVDSSQRAGGSVSIAILRNGKPKCGDARELVGVYSNTTSKKP